MHLLENGNSFNIALLQQFYSLCPWAISDATIAFDRFFLGVIIVMNDQVCICHALLSVHFKSVGRALEGFRRLRSKYLFHTFSRPIQVCTVSTLSRYKLRRNVSNSIEKVIHTWKSLVFSLRISFTTFANDEGISI